MNIINKVTLRHLKLNKKRTMVTIIGVIISVAMITAVATVVTSFLDMMKREEIQSNGYWHVMYKDVKAGNAGAVTDDKNTKESFISKDLGYAQLKEPANSDKPYIFLKQYSEKGFENFNIKLTSGRLPKNENEIVIPEHLSGESDDNFELGETIELELGDRLALYEDQEVVLNQSSPYQYKDESVDISEETFKPRFKKSYTVVGTIERPNFEYSWSPGYTVFTFADENLLSKDDTVDIYVVLNKLTYGLYDDANIIAEKAGMVKGTVNNPNAYNISFHGELIKYSGISSNDNINGTILNFAAIIIIIIIVGSVSLIYNAFAISISERSKYFGMLSSVGATKRQKRNSVYFEGFFIGAISIPIGIIFGTIGIGVTFLCVNPLLNGVVDRGMELRLVVSPLSIIAAVILSIITIFISTVIPARRASRISPIEAIRQSKDIRLKGKAIKTSRLTRKIFGFEAELALKNLKRNKKRYKATIFSLIISIVLFISVSTFTFYGTMANSMTESEINYDLSVSINNNKKIEETEALFDKVSKLENVKEYSIQKSTYATLYANDSLIVNDMRNDKGLYKDEEGRYLLNVMIKAMDSESFNTYLDEIKADKRSFENIDDIPAVLVDSSTFRNSEGKFVTSKILNINKGDNLQVEYNWTDVNGQKYKQDFSISHITAEAPIGYSNYGDRSIILIIPENVMNKLVSGLPEELSHNFNYSMFMTTDNAESLHKEIDNIVKSENYQRVSIYDVAANKKMQDDTNTFMLVFVYGFIILITAICVANIFNTISTSISLRKKEFAMLKSVGMTPDGFNKMVNYESLFYGIKALMYGLPISFAVILLMYFTIIGSFYFNFTLPWVSIAIVVVAVFVIVGITMMYSSSKIKKDNIVDSLKEENI